MEREKYIMEKNTRTMINVLRKKELENIVIVDLIWFEDVYGYCNIHKIPVNSLENSCCKNKKNNKDLIIEGEEIYDYFSYESEESRVFSKSKKEIYFKNLLKREKLSNDSDLFKINRCQICKESIIKKFEINDNFLFIDNNDNNYALYMFFFLYKEDKEEESYNRSVFFTCDSCGEILQWYETNIIQDENQCQEKQIIYSHFYKSNEYENNFKYEMQLDRELGKIYESIINQ